ncbi:MAG: cell division protein FtsQ/DivIB [Parvularculaceae bacterium]|nr:cell division protein FtsQ/DivIB [Parvularculaceae bacterium]
MPAVKRKKKKPSLFAKAVSIFENYTIAGVAGAGVILSLILVVLWAGGYFGMMGRAADRAAGAATASAGLKVERVLLRGAHQVAHEEVLTALGDIVGQPLIKVSLKEARRRIENLGWVRAAAVTRLIPDTIVVSIREREPAAVWQMSGDLTLIDSSGAIIRSVNAYEYSNLPLIVGSGAPDPASALLTAVAKHEELRKRIYALIRVGERRWDIRLRNNTEIRLPETGFEKAIADIALMHAAQATLDQPFEYIDLRDPERSVFRPRKDAKSEAGEVPAATVIKPVAG